MPDRPHTHTTPIKFLLLSHDAAGCPLAYALQESGHDVKVFIQEKESQAQYDGLLTKVKDWRAALSDDRIIICDSLAFGLSDEEKPESEAAWKAYTSIGDQLREDGYLVVGGSTIADRMELDRPFGAKVANEAGLLVPKATKFTDFKKAAQFVEQTKKRYILKPSGNQATFDLYPAEGWEDMVDYLEDVQQQGGADGAFELQEFVDGHQLSCEGWWNGERFVSLNHTAEHKPMLSDDLGPFTGETGSLIYYSDPKKPDKMAEQTILKMADFCRKHNFAPGPLDANCIVTEDGCHFLEWTARFGYPALYLQLHATTDDWGQALHDLATGTFKGFTPKPEPWHLIARVWIPKWPYGETQDRFKARQLFSRITDVHWPHVLMVDVVKENGILRTGGTDGEILCVTASGYSIEEARAKLYQWLHELYLYPMGWRSDLGITFLDQLSNFARWKYYVPAER